MDLPANRAAPAATLHVGVARIVSDAPAGPVLGILVLVLALALDDLGHGYSFRLRLEQNPFLAVEILPRGMGNVIVRPVGTLVYRLSRSKLEGIALDFIKVLPVDFERRSCHCSFRLWLRYEIEGTKAVRAPFNFRFL